MRADTFSGPNVQLFISRFVLPFLGMLLSVFIGVFISDSDNNNLSTVILLLGVAGFAYGALSPRRALYLLIFLCGYLDLLKRCLLFFGGVGFFDLVYVLGTAPLTLLGVCIGVMSLAVFRRVRLTAVDIRLTLLAGVLMAATLLVARRDGGTMRDLVNTMANSGAYFTLLVIVGVVFHTESDLRRFLKTLVLGFLPVAIYGIYQYIFGLADYEVAYLQSGLSVTEGNLYDTNPRPFSTLNSPHAFAVSIAILFLLSLYPLYRSRERLSFALGNPFQMLVPLIYLVASFLSVVRAGWLVWLIGLISLFCFTRPRRTVVLYAGSAAAFLLMVFNADLIEHNLISLERLLPTDSSYTEQAFRLQTFSDRLQGFKNLTNSPAMYSLFGLPADERGGMTGSHDQVGQILQQYGIVGILSALFVLVVGLRWLHRAIFRIRDRDSQRLAVVCLAAVFGVIFGGMVTGGHIGLFPVNFLFWFLAGTVIKIVRLHNANPSATSVRADGAENEETLEVEVAEEIAPVARPMLLGRR